MELLTQHKDQLEKLATTLLEREVLDGEEVRKIVGIPEEKQADDTQKTSEEKT